MGGCLPLKKVESEVSVGTTNAEREQREDLLERDTYNHTPHTYTPHPTRACVSGPGTGSTERGGTAPENHRPWVGKVFVWRKGPQLAH